MFRDPTMHRAWQRPLGAWVTALTCPSLTNQTFSAGSPSRNMEVPLEYFFSTILRSNSRRASGGTSLKISVVARKLRGFAQGGAVLSLGLVSMLPSLKNFHSG